MLPLRYQISRREWNFRSPPRVWRPGVVTPNTNLIFDRSHLGVYPSMALAGWVGLVVVQAVLLERAEYLLVPILCIIGGFTGLVSTLRLRQLLEYPASSLMLLGYTLYYFILPPIGTLLDGNAISNNLVVPNQTLVHAIIGLATFLGAHMIYRNFDAFGALRSFLTNRFYQPLGFFTVPSYPQLISIGAIGLAAFAYRGIFISGYAGSSGIFAKFAAALTQFCFIPFVILVPSMIGARALAPRGFHFFLAVYTVVVFIVSLGWNSRTMTFAGFVSIGLVYIFGVLVGQIDVGRHKWRNICLAFLGIVLVAGPFSDLSFSITVVRSIRSDVSPWEVIKNTWTTFNDKAALADFRKSYSMVDSGWDEGYVSNVFLARLCNLKYADNAISMVADMDKGGRGQMRSSEWERLISFLPQPVLTAFHVDVDKTAVTSASGGDVTLLTSTGASEALGSMRTGSLLGSGFAVAGWGYPFVLGAIAILTFLLGDAFAKTTTVYREGLVVSLSPVLVIGFYGTMFYLTSAASGCDNVAAFLGNALRGWLQTGVVYGFVFYLARLLSAFFGHVERQSAC